MYDPRPHLEKAVGALAERWQNVHPTPERAPHDDGEHETAAAAPAPPADEIDEAEE